MRIVSIIPARGGSKGIPQKNIIHLMGKPLLVHTIEQSLDSILIDETIVSTDDSAIKDIAERNGATVIKRPIELAGDFISSEEVIKHTIKVLEEQGNKPDIIVFLQCTLPIRRKSDMDKQIQKLMDENYDSVFSVTKAKIFIWTNKNGVLTPLNYDYKKRPMRQNKDIQYDETGSIYVFKTDVFEKESNRICGKFGIYEMPYECSFDIDDYFDLWLCEKILERDAK